MRLGRATMLAAVVWVLGLPGQLVGQDDFQDRYRAAVRLLQDREATARARAQAFDRALSAFLRISQAAPGYRQRLELGAYCAAQAGKNRMAAQLYERAWELGQRTAGVLEARLRAMVTGGDFTAAVMLRTGLRACPASREPNGTGVSAADGRCRSALGAHGRALEQPDDVYGDPRAGRERW